MRNSVLILAMLLMVSPATAADWRHYSDPEFRYSIDVPDDGFDAEADAARNGLTLYEDGGRGQIDVYAFSNKGRSSLEQVRAAVSEADRIKDITYSRSGASWFVISGHYKRLTDVGTDLIFYAKFMFSPDRRSISAFEASYPISDKKRYDPIIERIENTLTAPR